MMQGFKAPPLSADFIINDAAAIRSMRQTIPNAARDMKGAVAKDFGLAGENSGKAFIKGLKSELGKGSEISQFTKLAQGGGAIAGASMAAAKFQDMTEKMAEFSQEARQGDMAFGAFVEKCITAIPVIGAIWQGGRNIRETITGQKGEMELLNKEASLTSKFMDDSARAAMTFRGVIRGVTSEIDAMNRAIAIGREKDALAKTVMGLKGAVAAEDEINSQRRAADRAKVAADYGAKVDDARQMLEAMRTRYKSNYSGPGGILGQPQFDEKWAKERGQSQMDVWMGRDPVKDLEEIRSAEQRLLNLKTEQNLKLQAVDDRYRELSVKREEKLGVDILNAQKEAGRMRLQDVESQMIERRRRQDDAADDELEWRKKNGGGAASTDRMSLMLPSTRVDAEKLFGRRTVTSDGPNRSIEIQTATQKATEKTAAGIAQLVQLQRGDGWGGGVDIVMISIDGAG